MDRFRFDVAVCRVCEGPCPAGFALCFCCRTAVRQLQLPLAPVMAITTYRVGDRTHRVLRGYKDAPVGEVRRQCVGALSALVERWRADNAGRLRERFGHPWSVVATVPSSCRPTGSPADAVATRVPDLARLHRGLLVRGAPGRSTIWSPHAAVSNLGRASTRAGSAPRGSWSLTTASPPGPAPRARWRRC